MNCNSLFTTRKRLLIVILSIVFLFTALFVRLIYVQVVKGSEFSLRAKEQWYRDLPLKAPRGIIYDRKGNALAENKTVYTVYVRPNAVKDAPKVASLLSQTLNLDEKKLLDKIKNSKVSEITVKKAVDSDTGKFLINQMLDGVYFSADNSRSYPNSEILTQVLGYTNIDNEGQNGLEGYYNQYLKGLDGTANTQTDNRGKEIEDGDTYYVPSIAGANLLTSIDTNIQSFVESALTTSILEWNAKSANMIVMDVNTGAIVAMGQSPSYNLDNIPRDDIEMLNAYSKNTMIVDVFEPGSTFKIFTTAIALNNNLVSQNDSFFCPGYRIVDGQRIKCWRSKGHASQRLDEGVMNSCNCVFMDLALRLGTTKLYSGLRQFGFGKKTGVDFFSESSGLLMPEKSVKTVDLARIGFGQAVAMTPLQLITGVSMVVNGGYSVTPHFVEKVYDNYGNTIYSVQNERTQVLNSSVSKTMCELLENVVSKGSGKKASVEGYRIGGKTGTAQKYENGAIAQGKYVSSFVGFAPVENPKYAILMTINEPTGGAYYGSIVAAPYVGQVFERIFAYEEIKPTQNNEEKEYVTMPQLETQSVDVAMKKLKELGLQFEIDGEGDAVLSTLPIVGTEVEKGDIVLIRT